MIDQGKTIDLVFFDYAKAFDTVCHSILLQNLQCLGIVGDILQWIEVFLTNRSMQVKIAGHLSRCVYVSSGVPQGSVLGPLLFLIHINHVVSRLSCKFMIFADDIKIYFSPDVSNSTSIQTLQNNIDFLVSTSSWGLKINPSKCAVIRFSPQNCPLPFTR